MATVDSDCLNTYITYLSYTWLSGQNNYFETILISLNDSFLLIDRQSSLNMDANTYLFKLSIVIRGPGIG